MPEHDNITLKLSGSRAPHGVDLGALDGFLTHFLSALRDFDRFERGEPARKVGMPEASANAATALRLVSLRPGSAVAELQPIFVADETGQLSLGDPPRARLVVDHLLDRVEHASDVPYEVATSLERARRACGEDGQFTLSAFAAGGERRSVLFDKAAIAGLAAAQPTTRSTRTISGRLTRLEESPDKAVIRSPDGTAWTTTYPPELAEQLQPLWRQNVHATGNGERTTPRKGTFVLAAVTPLLDVVQSELFTAAFVETEELLIAQGIEGPQGLIRVAAAASEFVDPVLEDRYLAALFDGEE